MAFDVKQKEVKSEAFMIHWHRYPISIALAGILLIAGHLIAGDVRLSWPSNSESDLAGYQIYYGTTSNIYSWTVNVKNVTQYTIQNLNEDTQYYFALTAYDQNGNESSKSSEFPLFVKDITKPTIDTVYAAASDLIVVVFSESVELTSAQIKTNYGISDENVIVQDAELQSDLKTVYLTTLSHTTGNYTLSVCNVRDRAVTPNTIVEESTYDYSYSSDDQQGPTIVDYELFNRTLLVIQFSEAVQSSSALNSSNYSFDPSPGIDQISFIDSQSKKIGIYTSAQTVGQLYTVTINNVADVEGNAIAANTVISYTCESGDITPPYLIAVRPVSGTLLELEFSKTLDQTIAQELSNYSIWNVSTQQIIAVGNASLTANTTVQLTTDEHVTGNYRVQVSNVEDTYGNTISTASLAYLYTEPDETRPTVVKAEASYQQVKVYFSEPVDETSASRTQNYEISPSITVTNAYVAKDSIVFLETSAHSDGETYTVTVSNVFDQADPANQIGYDYNFATYTYTKPDETPPVLTNATIYGTNLLELTFSEAIEITSGETVDNYSIIPTASTESAIVIESAEVVRANANRIYLHTTDHNPGKSYTIYVSNLTDQASPANTIASASSKNYTCPVVDVIAPQLTGATLSGDKNLMLTFSEPMDTTTAKQKANYSISPTIQINEVYVMQSLEIVMLVTEAHSPSSSYEITVKNLKDMSGNTISTTNNPKSYTCESVDNAAPVFLYAYSRGATTVELCFDEQLEVTSATNKNNYSINNSITVEGAELSNSGMEVFLTTSTHMSGGNYTVTARNIKDRASIVHTMGETSRLYTYAAKDTTPPIFLKADIVNPTLLALYFNEAIENTSAKYINNYVLDEGIDINTIVNDQSEYIIYLYTTEHKTDGTYSVKVNNLADNTTSQNKMKTTTTLTYKYVKNDVTGPKVVKAGCLTESVVVITFDEALESSSAMNSANYSIHNDTKSIEVKNINLSPDQSQVTLTTEIHMPGQYMLTLNNIKDNSANANLIEPYTPVSYYWNPVDSTKPKLLGAEAFGDRNVKLTFSEYMSSDGVSDTSNYSIEPKVKVNMAILDGGNPYVVLLTTEPHANGVYTIKVNNLKDLAFTPNVIDPNNNSAVYPYEAPDTTPPSVESVLCKSGGYSVWVSFSEPVERISALNTANYQIAGIDINGAALQGDMSTVVLETDQHTGNKTYTCIVKNIKDRASNPNIMTTPDTVEYQYIPPDDESPTLTDVRVTNSLTVQLLFSEELEASSAETRNNYKINDGPEIIKARLKEGNASVVILTTASEQMPGIPYTVVIKNVCDLAGNVIESGTWKTYEMTSTNPEDYNDDSAPYVVRVEMLSDVSMRIVFSEAVDKETAQNTKNYYIGNSIQILNAVLDSNLTRVTLSTTQHSSNKVYNIQVTGIQDRASTPNILSSSGDIGYIYSKGVGLSCLSRPTYLFSVAASNSAMYVDRNYTFTQFPDELNETMQIQTANADKSSSGTEFLTFEMTGSGNLFIAYDAQIDSLPIWLSTWKITGLQIINSHNDVFNLYSKTFNDDQIVLGGNYGSDDDNMYLAFVKPFATGSGLIASLSKSSYKTSYVAIGEEYYLDRSAYKLASLPDSLQDLMWIKTANDDKMAVDDEFLKIQITAESKIFIGYDSRVKRQNMPDWLTDWTKEDGQIVDSRANKFDIYSQLFEAGEVVLGGNEGTAENNMYLILVERIGGNEPVNYSHMPGFFTLSQNYPNPFNPDTKIQYTVHKPGRVTIIIYNILGQQVKVLFDEVADEYGVGGEILWDGTDTYGVPVASGIYIYRIKQHQFSITKRMVLVR